MAPKPADLGFVEAHIERGVAVVTADDNPGSILASLYYARENARTIRDIPRHLTGDAEVDLAVRKVSELDRHDSAAQTGGNGVPQSLVAGIGENDVRHQSGSN